MVACDNNQMNCSIDESTDKTGISGHFRRFTCFCGHCNSVHCVLDAIVITFAMFRLSVLSF